MGARALQPIVGIHHVTAIVGNPQRNVDFYHGVLGLRLVKKTVNFDDPGTYHLYFGDEVGAPGTIMTVFAWPGAYRGRRGTGQVTATAFAVPPNSIGYWADRLSSFATDIERRRRFDQVVIAFEDPDGLSLELVEDPAAAARPGWEGGPVASKHSIRGFHGVTVCESGYEGTARLLTDTMGLQPVAEDGNRYRYRGADQLGVFVDVVCEPEGLPGQVAVGTVHHVAFRAHDEDEQLVWREQLLDLGLNVTPVIDRCYFHSIYFREPGGVLFEIATEPPGFAVDEPVQELGTALKLPPWLERERPGLEQHLPPVAARAVAPVRAS